MKINLTACVAAAALLSISITQSGWGAEQPERQFEASFSTAPDGRGFLHLDIIAGRFEPKPGVYTPATVGSLVEFIREHGPDANIVLSPGTADIKVENLRVRSVSLEDFFQALAVATDQNVQWRRMGEHYALMSRRAPEPGVEVFNLGAYLSRSRLPNLSTGPKPERRTDAQLLERVGDLIMETVSFASRNEADRSIELRFHEEARLLVVKGTPKALEVARKVVAALNNEPEKPQPFRRELLDDIVP
jgi:hypothetical protein